MNNKYVRHTHLSEPRFKELLKYFGADLTATEAANLSRINRNTANRMFRLIRERIAGLEQDSASEPGTYEVDESYFGAKRVRGRRGRGAMGKIPVFGILKRGGEVHVKIVENCSREQLLPIIRGQCLEGSVIYSDGWAAYDGLILNGYKHYRIHHHKDEFARGKNHINGIESFWAYAKHRLVRLKGIRPNDFWIHLKECEFRFNNRDRDLYKLLLSELRKNPLG